MQGGVDHDGLALLELHLHLHEKRDVHTAWVLYMGWLLLVLRMWEERRSGLPASARLHGRTKAGRVSALLAALASHPRRQPIEFAFKTVAVRG